MEANLRQHFETHFSQAKGTHLTKGLIIQFLLHDMNTQVATVFKQGLLKIHQFSEILKAARHILTELQRGWPHECEKIYVELYYRNVFSTVDCWELVFLDQRLQYI